jgi:CHASE2 domain-containing sensor protein
MPFRFHVSLNADVRRNLIALLLISLAVLGLERFGWLSHFENTAVDSFLLAGKSRLSEDIFIVEVTDDDYRDRFHSKSPLDAAEVHRILTLISRGQPGVIGVDLDTSSTDYGVESWPAAVWARDAIPKCDEHGDEHGAGAEADCTDARRFLRQTFLGGKFTETATSGQIETEPRSGLILFPLDHDGVVRRYRATFFSDQSDPPSPSQGDVQSFPRAVLEADGTDHGQTARQRRGVPKPYHGPHAASGHADEDLFLNYSGDRYQFPRMSVQQLTEAAERPYWAANSPLKGRIVLVGGAYRAARDVYVTPVGLRRGVEIVAQAIESELTGGGFRPINHWIALAIDIIAGLGLIWLNKIFHGRFVLLISALFIVVASLLGSYLSFSAFAYWFNFTAVLVSVWIHVLWEREAHARETQEQLRHAKSELLENRQERDHAREALLTAERERDEFRTKFEALVRLQPTLAKTATEGG